MVKSKAKTVAVVKDFHLNVIDQRCVGSEPVFNPKHKYTELEWSKIYNWYNYVLDEKNDRVKCVLPHVQAPKDRAAIQSLPAGSISNVLATLCRLKTRGWNLGSREKRFQERLDQLIRNARFKTLSTKLPTKPKKSSRPTSDVVPALEQWVDEASRDGTSTDAEDIEYLLRSRNLNPKQTLAIVAFYQPLLDELDLAIKKKDKQVTEAYRNFKPKRLKEYRRFISIIIDECNKFATSKKKPGVRKPRKKKPVLPARQVERIKFMREERELELVSIDPVKIIDAHELWLYNTRTRMLQHYVSEKGFKVKGTTLQEFDGTTSIAKKIRKPETLAAMLDQGPKSILKDFMALKTTPYKCNGRFNEFTLILKAIK